LLFYNLLYSFFKCQWYWGSISPSTATKLLKGYQPGTFLVRDSRSDNSIFSFSYSTNNGIYHTRINCFNGRFCLGGPRSLIGTESLPQFINDIIANCSPAVKDVSEFLSISEVGDENELNSRPLRVLMHPPLHTNPVSQQVDIRFEFLIIFAQTYPKFFCFPISLPPWLRAWPGVLNCYL